MKIYWIEYHSSYYGTVLAINVSDGLVMNIKIKISDDGFQAGH